MAKSRYRLPSPLRGRGAGGEGAAPVRPSPPRGRGEKCVATSPMGRCVHRRLDARDDRIRFLEAVLAQEDADLRSLVIRCVQRLRLAVLVMLDQMIGRAEDRLCAAEVFAEIDNAGLREIAFEVEDIADVGAAPTVDRLIGIADHAEVGIIDRQPAGDGVLRLVRVLVLIDEHIAKARIEFRTQVGVILQCEGRPKKQIVEVERIGVAHLFLVHLVHLGDDLPEEIAGLTRVEIGRQQLVLRLADPALNRLRREADIVDLGHVESRLDDAHAIGLIVDREVAVKAEAVGILAKHANAERVERADPDALSRQHRFDTLLHLVGSLVRERDREKLRGADALLEQMCDSRGDDARLAGARSREDEQRPVRVKDRLALVLRQLREHFIEGRRHAGLRPGILMQDMHHCTDGRTDRITGRRGDSPASASRGSTAARCCSDRSSQTQSPEQTPQG